MSEKPSGDVFQFGGNDFGPLPETTWRQKLEPQLKAGLERRTGELFESWYTRSGYARIVFSREYEKENWPFYRQFKLYFNVPREQKDSCDFGLWLMKKGPEGEQAGGDRVDLPWDWNRLANKLKDDDFKKQFAVTLTKHGFQIFVDEMYTGNHNYYDFKPGEESIQQSNQKSGEKRDFSWDEFFEYLASIPKRVTTQVEIYRTQSIGEDLTVQLAPVIDALKVLTPMLSMKTSQATAGIELIGAEKDRNEALTRVDYLKKHGKLASWWSYPVRGEYRDLIESALPINYYIYSDGELFMEWRVSEFKTKSGNEGMESPWPEYTIEREVGKARMGDKGSQICKTWFLIDEMKELERPLKLDDFVDYKDGTEISGSSLRNSFGYVRRKREVPVVPDKPLNPIYRYFSDRGFHFPNEVITDYYLSLKTKPFVILSGISGTGKTKIAQVFAEYMCPPEEVEVTEIPPFTENEFYATVGKAILNHHYLNIRVDFTDYFEIPDRGKRVLVTLEFDGKREEAVLRNIGFADPSYREEVRLHFRKAHMDWIEKNFSFGDIMRITVVDPEKLVYRLEKYEHLKKKPVESTRWAFISVRPDWTDNRGLLGFYNLLREAYQPTELLKIMLKAKEDPERPYFVILDEMNLAKVEYYFSDFLSCLESRVVSKDGGVRQEAIRLHDKPGDIEYTDTDGTILYIPPSLEIPENLYFTGTVNVDETTYMFSPKVIDRANTMEFNVVELETYGEGGSPSYGSEFVIDANLDTKDEFGGYELARMKHYSGLDRKMKDYLLGINRILEKYHLHFGYRVANEIALYIGNAVTLVGVEQEMTAMDFQILQKVLPKFHGSRQKLEEPLGRLLAFCFGDELEEVEIRSLLKECGGKLDTALFPRTARKIVRMLRILADQGFVSFVE